MLDPAPTADTTAQQLAEQCKALAASRGAAYRYAYYSTGSGVGVWDEVGQRWIAVIEKTVVPSCPWIQVDREYLVNGEPVYKQGNWVEI